MVDIQRLFVVVLVKISLDCILEQAPVSTPPPVDALLHVTYQKRLVSGCNALLYQGLEIVPLLH